LETMLRGGAQFRRRLIVTDSLFSMDGDLAALAEITELAERYDAMLMVDEAHATGVFGKNGRGVAEFLSERFEARHPHPGPLPEGEGVIRVGTLSKALGSGGGFVCGSRSLIDWLANRARTYVFSTAQPPATSAAGIAALEIVEREPERRVSLLKSAAELRARLRENGWNTGESESQVIPIVIGDATRTMRLATGLRDAGFFVPGIRPPSVPEGESLLRLSLCYHHTAEMISGLTETLAKLR
jgi:7-keto-8-aminopelargonate synthetase-like enzyme